MRVDVGTCHARKLRSGKEVSLVYRTKNESDDINTTSSDLTAIILAPLAVDNLCDCGETERDTVPSHLTSQGSGRNAYTAAFYFIPGQPRFFLREYASTTRRVVVARKSFRAQCMLQCFIYIRFDTCLGFVLL